MVTIRTTFLFVINQLDALISQIYFGMKLYMFRTVRLSIISSLFTVHSAIVYVIQVCTQQDRDGTAVPSRSCLKAVYKPVWHIPLLSVQWINSWWWTDELSETCRVSCQNKFVKLAHLVGFIINNCMSCLKRGSWSNLIYDVASTDYIDWLRRMTLVNHTLPHLMLLFVTATNNVCSYTYSVLITTEASVIFYKEEVNTHTHTPGAN